MVLSPAPIIAYSPVVTRTTDLIFTGRLFIYHEDPMSLSNLGKLSDAYENEKLSPGFRTTRRGPIRLNSHPRFLSGVSAATYAASLPVGSITAYASSGVCRSRLEWGLARLYQSKYCIIDCLASVTES